jgi:hypothetical protein
MISPPPGDDKRDGALLTAVAALTDWLRPREGWADAVAALGAAHPIPRATAVAAPVGWPEVADAVCDRALGGCLAAAGPSLCWRQNTSYRDPTLLAGYRYCELLGPAGHARHSGFAVGLLYLAAHTHYPTHTHPAREVYHVLTDGSQWSMAGSPWATRPGGSRILHERGVPHSMRTTHRPLLAVYLWRGAVHTPARLA